MVVAEIWRHLQPLLLLIKQSMRRTTIGKWLQILTQISNTQSKCESFVATYLCNSTFYPFANCFTRSKFFFEGAIMPPRFVTGGNFAVNTEFFRADGRTPAINLVAGRKKMARSNVQFYSSAIFTVTSRKEKARPARHFGTWTRVPNSLSQSYISRGLLW